MDEKDCERLEIVARLMMGIAEIDDLNMMRDKSVKLLQQKIMELSEEQKHLSANAAPQKVGAWLGVGLKGVGGVGGGWVWGGVGSVQSAKVRAPLHAEIERALPRLMKGLSCNP